MGGLGNGLVFLGDLSSGTLYLPSCLLCMWMCSVGCFSGVLRLEGLRASRSVVVSQLII